MNRQAIWHGLPRQDRAPFSPVFHVAQASKIAHGQTLKIAFVALWICCRSTTFPPIVVNFLCNTHQNSGLAFDFTIECDLKCKDVFTAGSPKGIGPSIAITYDKAGFAVICVGARSRIWDVDESQDTEENGKMGLKVLNVKLDAEDWAMGERVARNDEDDFIRQDLSIDNMGYCQSPALILYGNPNEWRKTRIVVGLIIRRTLQATIATDTILETRGPYPTTRLFFLLMLEDGHQSVLDLSSTGTKQIAARLQHLPDGEISHPQVI